MPTKENMPSENSKSAVIDPEVVNNIGSVYFKDKATEKLVREAMLQDKVFATKIMELSKSQIPYTFEWSGEKDLTFGENASTESSFGPDENSGNPIISFETYKGSAERGQFTSLYHETQHAMQFERGDLGFAKTTNGKWTIDPETYDIKDEIEAFEAGMDAPGYSKYHKDEFMHKTLEQKAEWISRRNSNYKAIYEKHGLKSMPYYPSGMNGKVLIKTSRKIRFQKTF